MALRSSARQKLRSDDGIASVPHANAIGTDSQPLPAVTELRLQHPLLWQDLVLGSLEPEDVVRLSHVDRDYRTHHISDAVWKARVEAIAEGRYLKRLKDAGTLSFLRKTYMHAFVAGTTYKCETCGEWTHTVNVLSIRRECWQCFATYARTEVMLKSKASAQYLLSTKEANSLPAVKIGDSSQPFGATIMVLRRHAEATAIARYEDGMAGLLRDKDERKVKAETRRKQILAAYEKKKAEAQRKGTKAPKYPKESDLLHSEIDPNDVGWISSYDKYRQFVLVAVGYPSRTHPAEKGLHEGQGAGDWFVCVRCKEAEPKPSSWELKSYPSHVEVLEDHLLHDCPNISDGDRMRLRFDFEGDY